MVNLALERLRPRTKGGDRKIRIERTSVAGSLNLHYRNAASKRGDELRLCEVVAYVLGTAVERCFGQDTKA